MAAVAITAKVIAAAMIVAVAMTAIVPLHRSFDRLPEELPGNRVVRRGDALHTTAAFDPNRSFIVLTGLKGSRTQCTLVVQGFCCNFGQMASNVTSSRRGATPIAQ